MRRNRKDRPAASRPARSHGLWMAIVLVVIATVGGAAWLALRPAGLELRRIAEQNVLLVTIDTLRADTLGSYGGAAATPNIDALARRGARFTFAHAHAVVTLPSHASILTGLYPHQHGIRDNTGYRLAPEHQTLATLLRDKGWATAAFVGAFPLDSRFGLNQGFATYDDLVGESSGPADFTLPERPAERVVNAACRWIGEQRQRWFAWVHVYDPHAPYRPPAPFDRGYRERPYDGEVAYVDRALEPLLAAAASTSRPTLVIVTSDHGEAMGDHGEATHGLFAYEATLRVPLIIAQLDDQSRPPRAVVSDAAVRHVDVAPTVLGALGIRAGVTFAGTSLVGLIEGRAGDAADRGSYFEAMSASLNRGWAPLQGVLVGREKYISLPMPELYDLSEDPGEQRNLVETRAGRERVLSARLREFQAPIALGRLAESAEVTARLKALGYVSGSAPSKSRYTEDDDPKRLVGIDRDIHRGIELFEAGRLRESADVFRGVIARRPDTALAYRHLAFLQWQMGDRRAAIQTLRGALAAGAATHEVEAQLGAYLAETGAAREAIPLLEALANAGVADVDALNALGIAYGRGGAADRALDTFRTILEQDATNAMALQNMGSIHLQRGNVAAARASFTRALQVDPRLARAHTGLGAAELKAGNRERAFESWRRAVALDPREYDALYNLASELILDGRIEAARPYLDRFVRTAPPAFYADDIRRLQAMLERP